MSGGTSSG